VCRVRVTRVDVTKTVKDCVHLIPVLPPRPFLPILHCLLSLLFDLPDRKHELSISPSRERSHPSVAAIFPPGVLSDICAQFLVPLRRAASFHSSRACYSDIFERRTVVVPVHRSRTLPAFAAQTGLRPLSPTVMLILAVCPSFRELFCLLRRSCSAARRPSSRVRFPRYGVIVSVHVFDLSSER